MRLLVGSSSIPSFIFIFSLSTTLCPCRDALTPRYVKQNVEQLNKLERQEGYAGGVALINTDTLEGHDNNSNSDSGSSRGSTSEHHFWERNGIEGTAGFGLLVSLVKKMFHAYLMRMWWPEAASHVFGIRIKYQLMHAKLGAVIHDGTKRTEVILMEHILNALKDYLAVTTEGLADTQLLKVHASINKNEEELAAKMFPAEGAGDGGEQVDVNLPLPVPVPSPTPRALVTKASELRRIFKVRHGVISTAIKHSMIEVASHFKTAVQLAFEYVGPEMVTALSMEEQELLSRRQEEGVLKMGVDERDLVFDDPWGGEEAPWPLNSHICRYAGLREWASQMVEEVDVELNPKARSELQRYVQGELDRDCAYVKPWNLVHELLRGLEAKVILEYYLPYVYLMEDKVQARISLLKNSVEDAKQTALMFQEAEEFTR